MVFFTRAALAACFTSLSYASPLFNQRAVEFEALGLFENTTIPRGWDAQGLPKPDTSMKMQIALKQNNIAGLQTKLMDISNPNSPNYGKWLSQEEVEVYTSPAAETVQAVKTWLTLNGISESNISQPTADWIEISVPVSKMEAMLSTQYTLYQDASTGKVVPRTDSYSIPLVLHDHIDLIQPTTAFHRNIGPQKASTPAPALNKRKSGCDPNNIVPSCILSFYNVDYTSKGNASLAVTGLLDYSASTSDATTFIDTYYPQAHGAMFESGSISGATNNPNNPVLEGNLDTQYALSLGYPNPTTYYAVGPNNDPDNQFGDELIDLGNFLNSATSPPSSISISYAGEEQTFNSNYLTTICNNFMKAGARGVSIFFSSGDFGVGGNGESSCASGFYANFPASCPYITSVGGTQFVNGAEEAATFERGGSTGGGFSYFFSAPSYQTSDTASYIKKLGSTYSGLYNPSGRGYPDVALVGKYYDIILNGSLIQAYGTSASSPSWAALISLINDYRHSEGKASLGFLNPLLYGNARSALNDITTGNNQGCGVSGFNATTGWDPTTGLGSMNFAKLRAALG